MQCPNKKRVSHTKAVELMSWELIPFKIHSKATTTTTTPIRSAISNWTIYSMPITLPMRPQTAATQNLSHFHDKKPISRNLQSATQALSSLTTTTKTFCIATPTSLQQTDRRKYSMRNGRPSNWIWTQWPRHITPTKTTTRATSKVIRDRRLQTVPISTTAPRICYRDHRTMRTHTKQRRKRRKRQRHAAITCCHHNKRSSAVCPRRAPREWALTYSTRTQTTPRREIQRMDSFRFKKASKWAILDRGRLEHPRLFAMTTPRY
mmetsp:Transcript_15607/g.24661  ORF Transcript_15607/g.24661 Transcript_15607/m.24661 type:complete len:263 (-) Transcript_15607:705-1493(-)